MPTLPNSRRAARILLFVIGSGLAFSSCSRDILREGNEPIAGMIALIGLFASYGGWLAWFGSEAPATEGQRVWHCVVLEHVALSAILGCCCLWFARRTFFAGSLLVGESSGTCKLLIAFFAVVALFAVLARLELTTSALAAKAYSSGFSFASASLWKTAAISFVLVGALNSDPRPQTIGVRGKLQMTLASYGIPRAFSKDLHVLRSQGKSDNEFDLVLPNRTFLQLDQISSSQNQTFVIGLPGTAPQQFEATLADGTSLSFNKGLVTIVPTGGPPQEVDINVTPYTWAKERSIRYERDLKAYLGIIAISSPAFATKQFALHLPDRTSVLFREGTFNITLPDETSIEADTQACTANLLGNRAQEFQTGALLLDLLLALAVAAHLGICYERIRRAGAL